MSTPAAFWDSLAESYAAQPVGDPAAFEGKIAITKGFMSPDDVVLDVGCGTGSLALILAPFAREVHGLDVSPEMNRIAMEKAAAQEVGNVHFHLGTLESCTAFEPESLDGLCAYSILHLVPDLDDALRRMFALIKPGGFFVSSTVVLGGSLVPYRPLIAVMRWFGKAPEVAMLKRAPLMEAMRAAGFEAVEERDVGAGSTVAFIVARKPQRGE